MSLVYRAQSSAWPFWLAAALASGGAHVVLPAVLLAGQTSPAAQTQVQTGVQGAILFDLSDIIAAPSTAGEDSAEAAAAEDAPTVTESPEAVDPAKAADEPILNQTPYDVADDDLKFGVASPDPAEDTPDIAEETAVEYEEEQVDQPSALGSVAADASQASVSGVDAAAQSDTAQASSEGLTADQMAEITEWQKAVVLRIAKAKTYPLQARRTGAQGEVRVRFTIDRYGNVIARAVDQTSGHALLDQAALAVFDKLGKLPTPPHHLTGEQFTLVIPLNYLIRKG